MKYKIIFITLLLCCWLSPPIIIEDDVEKTETEIIDGITVYNLQHDYFTLKWNKPENVTPDSYNVYYRQHLIGDWIFISNVILLEKTIIMTELNIDFVYYDFGVTAIYNISESIIHYSLENTAVPETGWYIKWIK